ncbi:MAG: hypothetical protein DBY35_13710 [Bacteroidales bacterium]|nr:MAG: hypothetical protein DBY35_13710 [Bacteroidales bacterium]
MKQSIILENISARLGISQLNPMQQEMMATQAHDIVLLSPTGSGKTLAFTIFHRLIQIIMGCLTTSHYV